MAVRGKPPATVLSTLSLHRTGEYAEDSFPPETWGAELPNDWYLVFGNRSDYLDQLPLDQISSDAEVVACSVEEHVGMSYAAGWNRGRETWSVVHDSEQGVNHLEVHGALPSAFTSIRERLAAAQAAEDQDGEGDVDYLADVPVELAQTLTGFRHDQITLVQNDGVELPPELTPVLADNRLIFGDEKIEVPPELATYLAGHQILVGKRQFEKLQAASPQVAPPERPGDRRPTAVRFAEWLNRVLHARA